MSHPMEHGAGERPGPDRSRVPEPGELRPFRFPAIERFNLANGLPVLYAGTRGLPVVTVSLLLDAGGVHEAHEHAGLSSLTSGLLESGAGDRSASQIADDLERLGVQLGVGTSWDAAHLDLTGLRTRVPEALEILTDLVRAPTFPEAEVERLRSEQLAGILQRRAEPRGLANEAATRFVFSDDSAFSRPLGGITRTVERLTRDEVTAFHAARFTPATASMVVAGDLSAAEARDLLEEHFGAWTGAVPAPAVATVSPRNDRLEVVVVHRPGSVQSEIRVGQVGVARDTPDYFPLLVMNSILGGAFSSRLNLNLREKQGFTYGVSSAFVMRRLPGPFVISTAVQTEVTAPALAEIFRELQGMRDAPVTEAELDDSRNYLAGTFPLRLQTTDGVASRLAELAIYALPLDYFESYRARILAVQREEVLRVARDRLVPDGMTVVVVGDADRIRQPLEELGLAPVRVVDPAEIP